MKKTIDYNSFSKSKSEQTIIEIKFSDVLDSYKNVRKAQEGDIKEFLGKKFQRKDGKWVRVKEEKGSKQDMKKNPKRKKNIVAKN